MTTSNLIKKAFNFFKKQNKNNKVSLKTVTHYPKTIENHYEKYIGKADFIWHEIVMLDPHIDIFSFPPTKKRPFRLLVTAGVSSKKMPVPHSQLPHFIEVIWTIEEKLYQKHKKSLVNYLKSIARYPHDQNTWIGYSHSLENKDKKPYFPKINNKHAATLLMMGDFSGNLEKNFYTELFIKKSRVIFLTPIPITKQQLKLKLKHDTDFLMKKIWNKLPKVKNKKTFSLIYDGSVY